MEDDITAPEDYPSISTLMSFQDNNSTMLQTPENSQFSYVELNNTGSNNAFESQFLLPTSLGPLQVIVPGYDNEVNSAEDQTALQGTSYVDIPPINYGTRTGFNSAGGTPMPSTGTTMLSSNVLQSEPMHFESLELPTSIQNANSLLSDHGLHLHMPSSSNSQHAPNSNNITTSETTNRSVPHGTTGISGEQPFKISTAAKAELLEPSLRNAILTRSLSTSSVGLIDLNCTEVLEHQQQELQSTTDLFQQVRTEHCKPSILKKGINSNLFSLHKNGSSWDVATSNAGTRTDKVGDAGIHQRKTSFHAPTSMISDSIQISIPNLNSSPSKFSLQDLGSSQLSQNVGHNQPSFIVVPTTSNNEFSIQSVQHLQNTGAEMFSNGCKSFNKDMDTSLPNTGQDGLSHMLELPDVMSPFPRTPLAEDLFSNFNSKKNSDAYHSTHNSEKTSQFVNENVATCSYAETVSESNALGSIGASSFNISNLSFLPNEYASDVDSNSVVDHLVEKSYSNNGASNAIKIQVPSQYVDQSLISISSSDIELATVGQIDHSSAVEESTVLRSTALISNKNISNLNNSDGNKENLYVGSHFTLPSTSSGLTPEENSSIAKPLPLGQCLYEMVSMLKCSTCSQLFQDATSLVAHYQKVHNFKNQVSPVKITVRTSNASQKNEKPIVVCQQCGTAVPPPILDWYTTKVRGKPPGRRQKTTALPQANRNKSMPVSSSDSSSEEGSEEESSSLNGEEGDHDLPTEHRDSDDGMQIYVLGGVAAAADQQATSPVAETEGSPPRKRRSLRPPARLQLYDVPQRAPVITPPTSKRLRCRKPDCTVRLSTEENRDLHEQCHLPATEDDEAPKGFACPLCHLPCRQWHLTQRHLWRVHKRDVEMLVCGICRSYRAHNAYTLRVHQETHSSDRGYKCKECGLQFRQMSQLLGHSKTHSTIVPPAQCNICQKMFVSARMLQKHVKTVHENLRPHGCPHCEYRAERAYDLKTHIRKHTKETPIGCPVCSRRFSDQSSYRRHLLRHLPRPLLHCPLCSFATSLPFHFARHWSSTHEPNCQDGQSFNCKVCGSNWNSVTDYTGHSRSHHSDMIAQMLVQYPDPQESDTSL